MLLLPTLLFDVVPYARESMLGVDISEPKHPTSLKPRSSAKMMMMFGLEGRLAVFGLSFMLMGGTNLCRVFHLPSPYE